MAQTLKGLEFLEKKDGDLNADSRKNPQSTNFRLRVSVGRVSTKTQRSRSGQQLDQYH